VIDLYVGCATAFGISAEGPPPRPAAALQDIDDTYLSGSSITDKDKLEGRDLGCSFSHIVFRDRKVKVR